MGLTFDPLLNIFQASTRTNEAVESTATILFTYDDYLALPDDGKRHEIIGGELSMTPAPFTDHQRILLNIFRPIDNYVRKRKLGEVLIAPVDVILSMTDVVQPDLIFISRDHSRIITKKNVISAPDLVIEILSGSSAWRDRSIKKSLYEKYGVLEYWIVDPEEQAIEVYVLKENKFILLGRFSRDESMESEVLGGLKIAARGIFTAEEGMKG